MVKALAKLADDEVAQIDHVLFVQRTVEPECPPELLDLIFGEGAVDVGNRRIAGHQAEHIEEQRGDNPEHEKHLREPSQDQPHTTPAPEVRTSSPPLRVWGRRCPCDLREASIPLTDRRDHVRFPTTDSLS